MRHTTRAPRTRWLRWAIAMVALLFAVRELLKWQERSISSVAAGSLHSSPDAHHHQDDAPSLKAIHHPGDVDENAAPETTQGPGHAAAHKDVVDVHLFVVWSGAMDMHQRIVKDMAEHFIVLDIKYFDWEDHHDGDGDGGDGASSRYGNGPLLAYKDNNITAMERDFFLMNLWRLYSGKGGWAKTNMALKVRQCGRGPFVAVVVVDEHPSYQVEHTAHGEDTVNHNMNDAKKRYRKWSGGGFRVHGTFNPAEAAHDITLLFHKHPQTFYASRYLNQLKDGSVRAASRQRVEAFLNVKWPRRSGHGDAAMMNRLRKEHPEYIGPDGTLGYPLYRKHYKGRMLWSNCSELVEVMTGVWTLEERARLRAEGFYAWDVASAFPGEALDLDHCTEWPKEWAVVVPQSNWWAMASLLNGHLPETGVTAESLKDGPEEILVPVEGSNEANADSTLFEVHVRGIVSLPP